MDTKTILSMQWVESLPAPLPSPTGQPVREKPIMRHCTPATKQDVNYRLFAWLNNPIAHLEVLEVRGHIATAKYQPYAYQDPIMPVPLPPLMVCRCFPRAFRQISSDLQQWSPWLDPLFQKLWAWQIKRHMRHLVTLVKRYPWPTEDKRVFIQTLAWTVSNPSHSQP